MTSAVGRSVPFDSQADARGDLDQPHAAADPDPEPLQLLGGSAGQAGLRGGQLGDELLSRVDELDAHPAPTPVGHRRGELDPREAPTGDEDERRPRVAIEGTVGEATHARGEALDVAGRAQRPAVLGEAGDEGGRLPGLRCRRRGGPTSSCAWRSTPRDATSRSGARGRPR